MLGNRLGRRRTALARHGRLLALSLVAATSHADATGRAGDGHPEPALTLNIEGQAVALEPWESDYLFQAMARLQESCELGNTSDAISVPDMPFLLAVQFDDQTTTELHHKPGEADSAPELRLTRWAHGKTSYLEDCAPQYSSPVVAIIQSKRTGLAPETDDTLAMTELAVGREVGENALALAIEEGYPFERLSAYEQNHLGWTRDDNSVESGYMDAQMSFKFRAWEGGDSDRFAAFFAFSTRFSQYIETIESSPVVGKRYNPLLFLRTHVDNRQGYLDAGLAHESNGQSITTEEAYIAERQKYAHSDGEPDFARNSISRGWDYVFTDWTHCWLRCSDSYAIDGLGRFTTKLEFQYYLDDGPFQGNPEEYNDWEGGSERHRKEYDGIGLTSDYRINSGCLGIDGFGCSISWEYRTGYDGAFENSTNRLQLAVDKFWILPPIGFWLQTGHNSSLVDYYRSVDSVGIAMLFSNPY